jgi:hypothetical protein
MAAVIRVHFVLAVMRSPVARLWQAVLNAGAAVAGPKMWRMHPL